MSSTVIGDERFFALSHDLLAVVGFDGYFKRLNPAWERLTGWTPDELHALPYADRIHPEDRERALAEAARLAETGAETRDFELRFATRAGGWCRLLFSAQGSPSEEVIYALGREITERRSEEERLRTELERSNADLEQFAYVASHDLSEPLRMVSGFVQLLAERYRGRLDQDADEFIGYTVDGVQRMQSLISDLLEFSRVGRAPRDGPVDLGPVAEAALAGVGATVADAGAEVEIGPLPTVDGNRRELVQLFGHLLSNALKFTGGATPRIAVSAEPDDGWWDIVVRDNGIGIAPQHAERIFKVFQRLHGRDEYPGTGIGLAICKKIVERHGGEIAVEHGAAGGSAFHVRLPEAGEPGA